MLEYFALVIALLLLIVFLLVKELRMLKRELCDIQTNRQRLLTKHGLIFEQLIPFSKNFPGEARDFRFIGNPIDGVIFGKDKVQFVEIKMNNSVLNDRQRQIRDQIMKKKVEWLEVRGD
ncbi:Endonuclease related to archaeal Holliday junction resolvase [uncultured archaeon]|nr:Endonuclease related to archaeal Holliday junction resolvase [uncultured archaeon]